ncbi:MAG TPA: hypothetical protein VF669_17440, partial [Tepidisphaeraceae bacterium]
PGVPGEGKKRAGVGWVAVGVLAVLVYFSHVISLVMGVVVIGAMLVVARVGWRVWLKIGVALIPAGVLLGWFVLWSSGASSDRREVGVQLLRFFELDVLASFRRPEVLVGIFYSAMLWGTAVGIVVWKTVRRKWERWDWMLAIVLVTLGIYLAAPNTAAGGGQISFRLMLYPYFVLVLWLARFGEMLWPKAVTGSAATGVTVLLLVVHWPSYAKINVYLKEYETIAAHVESGKSIVAVDVSRDSAIERKFSWKVRPFWHAMGYVAGKKGLNDLGNYEIEMGYFPVVRRGGTMRGASEEVAGDVLGREFAKAVDTGSDYIMIWDLNANAAEPSPYPLPEYRERGHAAYEVVYRSAHRWATLYRKK